MTTEPPAVDRLGRDVGYPPHVPAGDWRRFCRQTVVLPAPTGCVLWLKPPRSDGYGQFWVQGPGPELAPAAEPTLLEDLATEPPAGDRAGRGRVWRAHRYAYAAWHGPIGPDVQVMHSCDEPLCVAREHLDVGTNRQNANDREHRGRTARTGLLGARQWGGADARGPYGRAVALHQALLAALAAGADAEALDAVLADVGAAGEAHPGQLSLDL
ncbi:HNH endonuclease [Longispora sp. NPDC051575]|uniref:HNH endonuclease n=1 Tax=Longispora sp. NPDC051575 TaxID=3154943 RepID=UPI003426E21E